MQEPITTEILCSQPLASCFAIKEQLIKVTAELAATKKILVETEKNRSELSEYIRTMSQIAQREKDEQANLLKKQYEESMKYVAQEFEKKRQAHELNMDNRIIEAINFGRKNSEKEIVALHNTVSALKRDIKLLEQHNYNLLATNQDKNKKIDKHASEIAAKNREIFELDNELSQWKHSYYRLKKIFIMFVFGTMALYIYKYMSLRSYVIHG